MILCMMILKGLLVYALPSDPGFYPVPVAAILIGAHGALVSDLNRADDE